MWFNAFALSVLAAVVSVAADGKGESCCTVSGWKGAKNGALPRKTSTITLPATTTTLTRTSVITSTSTLPPGTDTVTITETSTSVATETSTSTIPAPAGFTPVEESSGYTSGNSGTKRQEVLDTLLNRRQTSPASRWPKGTSPKKGQYKKPKPQYIQCVTTVQRTRTVRTTVTRTSTTTIIPSSVTSTSTTTTTSTSTSTSTTSFYAACATNNVLGPRIAQGAQKYVQGVGNSDPQGMQANVNAASAYDCCVICLTGSAIPNCQNTIFDADSGICNPIGGNTGVCPNGGQGNSGYVLLTIVANNRFDSNGPCGTLGADPAGTG